YRKHSIVLVLLVAAVITPPDIFSLVLVTIPLILLYELSIFIAARVVRKRAEQDAEDDEPSETTDKQ
ncbi:MAG: twin-arginine translocase subunit TatC, partial [Bacteroidales bacterium]|nr:twin-arginine translocase subunit TatC [Bacteroidales bacterium]